LLPSWLDSVAQVSAAVKGANPHWQVTMDTYASSAGDPGGFYDIAGLAPSVDAFFVMAYDMNGSAPSPTAALTGSGFTDLDALQEYTAVVPPSKVILGVPYYGYDWPTTGPDLGAAATGPPTPLSYAQIANANTVRSSVGVGLTWASPFGPLTVNYAVPLTKASYDVVQPLGFSAGPY